MIVHRATLRLTIQYSTVMLAIVALFAFGVGLYASIAFDLELPEASEEAINRANATLRTGLLICFAGLVILVPLISYVMARRALAPIRANLEAQQRFVDDAAHELRTPVAIAQGELELALLKPRTGDQYREAITEALGALNELNVLTTDLLLLTQPKLPAEDAEAITIEELGDRSIRALSKADRDRVDVQIVGTATIAGSPELLTRAVANLLENAGKFAPPETGIELRLEGTGNLVQILVRDHGPGMPPEDVRRAFESFWRADSSRNTPGRGIGLSIVRRITEMHDGRVSLRSSPGHGTTAVLELPAAVT